MIIKVKFISIPDVDKREMSFEMDRSDNVSVLKCVKVVSEKTDVDFTKNDERYMFILNSDFLKFEELGTIYVHEGDVITIMPMLAGG